MKIDQFEAYADDFIQKYLEKTPEDKRNMLSYILRQTKEHILGIIRSCAGDGCEDLPVSELNNLCTALDNSSQTFQPQVLETMGASDLDGEILNYRRGIKWQIYLDELAGIIPNDGKPFNPSSIYRTDKDLYHGIRHSLQQEVPEGETFDWELLRARLPNGLRDRFEVGKVSSEDKRRAIEAETSSLIEKLELQDVIAALGGDPKKLAYFLDISGLDLSERERSRIVYVSFSGLRQRRTEKKLDRLMDNCRETLSNIDILTDVPDETEESSLKLKVKVPEGAKYLLVRGPWNRDIKINGNSEVEFEVILTPGDLNEIVLLAYDEGDEDDGTTGVRSQVGNILIHQTGEKVNQDVLVELLNAMRDDIIMGIREDEEKNKLLVKCLEESNLKRFAGGFDEGEKYVRSLIREQKNPYVKGLLEDVIKLFKRINSQKFHFIREVSNSGEPIDLVFFQKYCVYKIKEMRASGRKNAILANEPGTGKTLTALTALHDDEMMVVCPNSAASVWIEQEAQFFKEPFLVGIAGQDYRSRMRSLKNREVPGVVTNIEFLRYDPKQAADRRDAKFEALNKRHYLDRARVSIVDEAHFLKNDSQQTEGIAHLEDSFMLFLTASPWRHPQSLCKVMARAFPDDPRFSSVSAFQQAFPSNSPEALKILNLLVQPYVIRFLKEEVMPTYDRKLPLNEQPLSLPKKIHNNPYETGIGEFTLTTDQEESILELFEDWDAWTHKYGHYLPKGRLAREDGIRSSDNRLSKEHALRQIVNDPKFIGSKKESPKQEEVLRIVDEELSGGHKVLVFCKYHNQVDAYAKLLEDYGVKYAMFTGEVRKKGYKKDENGKEIKYQVDEYGNFVLGDGRPVVAKKGQQSKKILALDFERLIFQNDPKICVCLSTFGAGSQSVTFTGADAIIMDDLPRDVTEEYQAEDRIHRMDSERRKYEVRYYNLVSSYSPEFLEAMKLKMIEEENSEGELVSTSAYDKWFRQGTLDRVHFHNLVAQRTSFEILNNGIATDPDLVEQETSFQTN